MQFLDKDDQELLNYCTKYLARGNRYTEAPPSSTNANLTRVSEAWRFPIIQSYGGLGAFGEPVSLETITLPYFTCRATREAKNV